MGRFLNLFLLFYFSLRGTYGCPTYYKFGPKTWNGAKTECESVPGRRLAKISDATMAAAVLSETDNNYWIDVWNPNKISCSGTSDCASVFTARDGSAVNLDGFHSDTKGDNSNQCLKLAVDKLDPDACTSENEILCEQPCPIATPSSTSATPSSTSATQSSTASSVIPACPTGILDGDYSTHYNGNWQSWQDETQFGLTWFGRILDGDGFSQAKSACSSHHSNGGMILAQVDTFGSRRLFTNYWLTERLSDKTAYWVDGEMSSLTSTTCNDLVTCNNTLKGTASGNLISFHENDRFTELINKIVVGSDSQQQHLFIEKDSFWSGQDSKQDSDDEDFDHTICQCIIAVDQNNCPDTGLIKKPGKRYWLAPSDLVKSWFEAKEICEATNMRLAKIDTEQGAKNVISIATEFNSEIWVDIWNPDLNECDISTADCNGLFTDANNVPITNSTIAEFESFKGRTSSQCMILVKDGAIKEKNCGDSREALCEIDCVVQECLSPPNKINAHLPNVVHNSGTLYPIHSTER